MELIFARCLAVSAWLIGRSVRLFDVDANFDVEEDMVIEMDWGAPLLPGMRALTLTYTPIGPRPVVRATGNIPVEVGFGTKRFRAAAMPGLAGEIVRHVRSFETFFRR